MTKQTYGYVLAIGSERALSYFICSIHLVSTRCGHISKATTRYLHLLLLLQYGAVIGFQGGQLQRIINIEFLGLLRQIGNWGHILFGEDRSSIQFARVVGYRFTSCCVWKASSKL